MWFAHELLPPPALARLTRSQAMPPLNTDYAVETYRLAWEYCLLSPEPQDALPMYWSRAAEAVGLIGDPRSLVTLLHVIRVASSADSGIAPEVARYRGLDALATIAEIDGPDAARGIAEGLAVADGAKRRPFTRDEGVTHVAKLVRVLPQEKRDRWRDVLRDSERSETPELRRLAAELRTRIEPP